MQGRFCNNSGREKAVNHKYSKCEFLALVIENVQHMRRTILPSMQCLAIIGFALSILNEVQFSRKCTSKVSWIPSTNLSEKFTFLEMVNKIFSKMCRVRPLKYPSFLSDVKDI